MNEGETATYVLSFFPTKNIQTTQKILIIFPGTFDIRLGNHVKIFSKSGLTGAYDFTIVNRALTIYNFEFYSISYGIPIKLEIHGVINPNKRSVGHSGYLSIGVMEGDKNKYVDYQHYAAVVETIEAPGWLKLNEINLSNKYSRDLADYTFNITAGQVIPSGLFWGEIIVDFPQEFQPVVLANKKCYWGILSSADQVACYIDKRMMVLNQFDNFLSGDLIFKITSIKNPLDEVTSGMVTIKTYNGMSRSLIERTYPNLDVTNSTYAFRGPTFIVNNNDVIYVERGSQTKDMYMTTNR